MAGELPEDDVAARIAQRTLASRAPDYTGEVRRLLDAGREAMRRSGTDARPRVADIVATAGLSNDAFYRHFSSKDALVAAILEDGAQQLRSYLDHQMGKESAPEGKLRRLVEGLLAQAADEEVAATTLAVMWNAGGLVEGPTSMRAPLASLLDEVLAAMGSVNPELDAALVSHALHGLLGDFLRRRSKPTAEETEQILAFLLAAVRR